MFFNLFQFIINVEIETNIANTTAINCNNGNNANAKAPKLSNQIKIVSFILLISFINLFFYATGGKGGVITSNSVGSPKTTCKLSS